MPQFGYSLSSEEFAPNDLVTFAPQLTVCCARTEKDAVRVAHRQWPISALAWPVLSELPILQYFEKSTANVTEDQIAETIVCGPSAKNHLGKIEQVLKAGVDHIYLHQVETDQEGFFRFYEREILPEFGVKPARAA